jgi:hypothetical protein
MEYTRLGATGLRISRLALRLHELRRPTIRAGRTHPRATMTQRAPHTSFTWTAQANATESDFCQLDQSLWMVLGLALASFQMVMCETWSPVALWMRKHTSQMK